MTSLEISELVESRINKNKSRVGYLYIVESLCKKRIKIGRSVRPHQRVAEISTISGGVSRIFVSGLVIDAVALESALHKAFSKNRTTGEWFLCRFDDVAKDVQDVCQRFSAQPHDAEKEQSRKKAIAERAFNKILEHFGVAI